MRRRIVVVGQKSLGGQAGQALREADVGVTCAEGDLAPPPATAAVLSTPRNLGKALQTLQALGDRGEFFLKLLAEAIDVREDVPAGASERVMEVAARLAREMGLADDEILVLEQAALLRGAGNVRISNDILLKKGLLNYDEWMELKRHPTTGAEMLRQAPGYEAVAEVVAAHHECYDGTGYPGGLERHQIPLLARVLKLADVYCAMTSARHYRSGQSTLEEAEAFILEERGKHFDPVVVDAFRKAREAGDL